MWEVRHTRYVEPRAVFSWPVTSPLRFRSLRLPNVLARCSCANILAARDAGVRGRELRKALELAFFAAPERWKLHVQTFSNGNVEMSRTETYTLDGCREFRFRRVKKGVRVWYGENGFGWSRG